MAKGRLRTMDEGNVELKAALAESAKEGEDVYFFMQRKLDDNSIRFELEKRLVEVEVEATVSMPRFARAARTARRPSRRRRQKELERADAEDKMRALCPWPRPRRRWPEVAELTQAVEDERHSYMETCADRDRAHIRAKESIKVSRLLHSFIHSSVRPSVRPFVHPSAVCLLVRSLLFLLLLLLLTTSIPRRFFFSFFSLTADEASGGAASSEGGDERAQSFLKGARNVAEKAHEKIRSCSTPPSRACCGSAPRPWRRRRSCASARSSCSSPPWRTASVN